MKAEEPPLQVIRSQELTEQFSEKWTNVKHLN